MEAVISRYCGICAVSMKSELVICCALLMLVMVNFFFDACSSEALDLLLFDRILFKLISSNFINLVAQFAYIWHES